MAQSSDGFVIAEADLQIRGPGDFLGTRQAGLPELKVADIVRNGGVLELARKEAFALVQRDPELSAPGDERLRGELMLHWGGRLELYRMCSFEPFRGSPPLCLLGASVLLLIMLILARKKAF